MNNINEFMVVDTHLHGPSPAGKIYQWVPVVKNYGEYLDYLARAGVRVGIQNSWWAVAAKKRAALAAGNRCALALARRSISRRLKIIPACIVHPSFPEQALHDMAMFRKAGSCWAGEMCPYMAGYSETDPALIRLAKLVEAEGFVFQVHGAPRSGLDKIARACPSLPLVVSHLGSGRKAIFERLALAADRPNVYLDICGTGHERMGILEKAVDMGLGDRLLYGSDFPINEPGGPIVRVLNSRLPTAVKRKILGLNAIALMRQQGMVLTAGIDGGRGMHKHAS